MCCDNKINLQGTSRASSVSEYGSWFVRFRFLALLPASEVNVLLKCSVEDFKVCASQQRPRVWFNVKTKVFIISTAVPQRFTCWVTRACVYLLSTALGTRLRWGRKRRHFAAMAFSRRQNNKTTLGSNSSTWTENLPAVLDNSWRSSTINIQRWIVSLYLHSIVSV